MNGCIVGSSLALDAVEKGSHNQSAASKRATATSREKLAMHLSISNNHRQVSPAVVVWPYMTIGMRFDSSHVRT